MKKILSGFIGIMSVLAIVGIAFALNFNQVSVSGISLTASNPDLQIASSDTASFNSDYNIMPDGPITNLRPGDTARHFPFALKNNSSSNMTITGLVEIGGPGWEQNVANYTLLAIEPTTVQVADIPAADWRPIGGGWNNASIGTLEANSTRDYNLWVKLSDNPDTIIAGKTLSDVRFTLTGN
jgi:hypothetical protein